MVKYLTFGMCTKPEFEYLVNVVVHVSLQFPFQQGQYEMERNDSAFESVDIDYGELDDEKRTPTPEPTRSPPKVKQKEMNLKKIYLINHNL